MDQPADGFVKNTNQGAPTPNLPAPPTQHPGFAAASGMFNQYPPVPGRPYYPQTVPRQSRSSSNQFNHQGYDG
jgi:hypothetical protein